MPVVFPLTKGDLSLIRKLARVRAVAKRDFPEHPEIPWKVKSGVEADLPRWLYEALEEEVVERSQKIDLKEIERMLHKEQLTSRPLRIPEDTYLWLKERAKKALLEERVDPLELRRLAVNLVDLCSTRLSKMLRYLLLVHVNKGWRLTEHLTPEERVLYLALRSLVEDWRSDLKGEMVV